MLNLYNILILLKKLTRKTGVKFQYREYYNIQNKSNIVKLKHPIVLEKQQFKLLWHENPD